MIMEKTRKVLLACALAFASFANAQYRVVHDPGEQFEYMTDYQWNNWNRGFIVGGVFVKNSIGVYTAGLKEKYIKYPLTIRGVGVENDSVVVEKDPRDTEQNYVSIKGFHCTQFTNYEPNDPYSGELRTLEEVRKRYCPEVKGKVVYMINKFFIMEHEDLYKVTPGYIYKVEKVKSTDIKVLSDLPEFTVIRIFTKTPHNMFPEKLGLFPDL